MLVEILLSFMAALLLIPALIFFVEILAAVLLPKPAPMASAETPTVAVLIPAHNESTGLLPTLSSIIPQLTTQDRLLVVADNCTDNTAEIAKNNGAEVIERQDATRRGKGYALDFGIQYLHQNPKQILIIVDADCIVDAGAINQLARATHCQQRPIQALYLMHNQANSSLKSKVAEFAWCVKNWVRPLGCLKLGLPCQLMGTGMAFPWQSIKNVDLANGNIVEDMKLGIDFALANQAPQFYPQAKVWSFFPTATDIQQGQSKRWEHGHMQMILTEVPRMMVSALVNGRGSLLAMALDLSVPPLALLVGLILGLTLLTCVLPAYLALATQAFYLSMLAFILMLIAVVLAWLGWGKKILSIKNMLFIPVYILLKIPNHLGFVFKRQSSWNKTKREHE